MMQPRRANIGAATIAHGADHARLQIPKGHFVGKPADVQFCVMMTGGIAAADEHTASSEAPRVGKRNGLVVKQQVRDCPGHRPSKRDRGG